MDRYALGNQIGEGSFGCVYLALKLSTGEKRAIKRIKGNFDSWDSVETMRELQSIRKLKYHPNIVRLFEVLREKNGSVYFVFEYMETGSIHDVLTNRSKHQLGPMPDTEIRCILQQILMGVSHLHEGGYVHRDFKPENILLSGRICKVADFSLAKEIASHSTTTMNGGMTSYVSTRWYRAPEILLCDKNYSYPVDIFAIGCIAAELYKVCPLFPGTDECDQLKRIFAVMGTPVKVGWSEGATLLNRFGVMAPYWNENGDDPSHLPQPEVHLRKWIQHEKAVHNHHTDDDRVVPFIVGLLALDPKKRLTAKAALEHRYFVGIDSQQFISAMQQKKPVQPNTKTKITTASSMKRTAIEPSNHSNVHVVYHVETPDILIQNNSDFTPNKKICNPFTQQTTPKETFNMNNIVTISPTSRQEQQRKLNQHQQQCLVQGNHQYPSINTQQVAKSPCFQKIQHFGEQKKKTTGSPFPFNPYLKKQNKVGNKDVK